MKISSFIAALAVVGSTGCFPVFDDQPTLVSRARILAVKSEPPEAERSERARFDALVASPDGTVDNAPIEWALCLRGRTLAERNGVAPDCLADEGEAIQRMESADVEVPVDACARFGPNPPPAIDPSQPQLRPADPDLTGGYYLPVRARIAAEGLVSFGFERLRCSLAGAPRDIFTEFQRRYRDNVNPAIEAIEGLETITAGARAELRVTLTSSSAETYPYYDPIAVALVDQRESISVSWFTSRGRFEAEKSGAENTLLVPAEAGPIHIWIVARDSRGGTAWRAETIEVR